MGTLLIHCHSAYRPVLKEGPRIGFLALSSCLGERFRARVSGFTINPRHGSYDRTYFRTMTNPGPSSSEHIELETMLNAQGLHPVDEDDDNDV
ncbi:uncharacterized protein Z520_00608 [Fonsecaea multimorphosa CBS 102226]|uniref:Uncharacterized protein n=1 Tax=Fonsecaea multimorphosa CBS 102226 TaxID=1442371 RepID=A0A0D2HPY4_9EURO|nr:uncharacterized protein Z520_00608 [Fonsecaea multimorphosa CBS 102226]KIY03916.1 hypothetical protein Z520_00608 [Fonsecaea multimorphosa CBS 102226]